MLWNGNEREKNSKEMRISIQLSPIQIMLDQKQQESVEYFSYLGNMIINDVKCRQEIKSRIALAKAAFNKKKALFTSKLDLNLKKKLVKCYIWIIAFYSAETGILCIVRSEMPVKFGMWCWRRMETSSTDYVRNEEVLQSQGGEEYPINN